MIYDCFTRTQLIERIEELEILNRELLNEKEQEPYLEYGWAGNLGHWYWNIKTNSVTFNSLKITTLGYKKEDIPEHVTYMFFTDKLHPDDYQRTMDAMTAHLYGESPVYEVEYRIQTKAGNYKWYYDRGKITQYDKNGKPVLLAGIVFDITEKKEHQLELELSNSILKVHSSTDGLTKIHNQRTLIEYLESQISYVHKMKSPLSIAIFDIDGFKAINDNHGHVYGDSVLTEVAAIIKNNIRDSDLAGRYGGDEFMVIFGNTELATAKSIANRIRQVVEETTFENQLHITISGGVKQYKNEDLMELIHLADINLYVAKNNGRNRII